MFHTKAASNKRQMVHNKLLFMTGGFIEYNSATRDATFLSSKANSTPETDSSYAGTSLRF